ncbi:MAG: hypothetical protein P4L83_01880 [Nevskia sp.]|nr:hypothetical protein [Nevskia sp.]
MTAFSARTATGLAAALLLGGCSWLSRTYNDTVDVDTSERVHTSVPVGTTMETAEARLSAQGFNCENRTGDFIDEQGRNRKAPHFLSCVRRPNRIGFACENRDQVIVVPSNGVADEIDVTRGPDCGERQAPPLMVPNSAK